VSKFKKDISKEEGQQIPLASQSGDWDEEF